MIFKERKSIIFLVTLFFLFFYIQPVLAYCCSCYYINDRTPSIKEFKGCFSLPTDKSCNAKEIEIQTADMNRSEFWSANCTFGNCEEIPECADKVVSEAPVANIDTRQLTPQVQVEIGDTVIQFDPVQCTPGTECSIPWLAQYIKVIYQYLIGLAAIIAAAIFLFGGFSWLTSFGSPDKVNKAKEYMTGAFTGLLLALFSYLILFTINPELVNLKPIVIKIVSPLLAELGEQKLGDPKPSATGAKPSIKGNCSSPRPTGTEVPAQITSYCKPQRSDREYKSDEEFYCDLAMQCTCPSGRDQSKVCNPGRREWRPCKPFDYQNTPYCNETASGQPPGTGLVAADPSCYPMGSKVCIEGSTYEVGDTGDWIDGDHFDLWNEDCDVARGVNRTVTASAGACP